jgi:hypothetical protein
VKHFHGGPVISWAMSAWNCKKHCSSDRFRPAFTRKWFQRSKHATCGLRVTLHYTPWFLVKNNVNFRNFRFFGLKIKILYYNMYVIC